jgi:hypothetical protein
MKSKKLFITLVTAILVVTNFQSCKVEPEYYSQVSPDGFYDSQEKVHQRFGVPFAHWSGMHSTIFSVARVLSTLSCDETLMPNRAGDWYDDGFYLLHYYHYFSPTADSYWESAWNSFSTGVAQAWSAMEDIDKYVDFDALGFPAGTRESMLGQLKVVVAYFYMFALDNFGGVPLYTSNQGELLPRSTDQETFDFIEKYLTESLPNLPKRQNGDLSNGGVTQGVAASLLAQLYFNAEPYIKKNMYTECEKICTDIKNGVYGSYSLAADFRDIFGFDNESCPELIWAAPSQNTTRELQGSYAPYATHYNTWKYFDNQSAMSWNGICLVPSQDINGKHYRNEAGNLGGPFKLGSPYDKFDDTDVRKQNFLYYGDNATYSAAHGNKRYLGMFLAGKLINPIANTACTADGSRQYKNNDTIAMVDQLAQLSTEIEYSEGRKEGAMYAEENSGVRLIKLSPIPNSADNTMRFNPDIPVIRLTEIQYMLAECKYHSGDKTAAANLINEVRARYFVGEDPNPVTAANLDKYRLADEWMIEFLGEGRRRTDLVRWNMFTTEAWWDHPADGPEKEHFNRFPIPQNAINANKLLIQNPGYVFE